MSPISGKSVKALDLSTPQAIGLRSSSTLSDIRTVGEYRGTYQATSIVRRLVNDATSLADSATLSQGRDIGKKGTVSTTELFSDSFNK